MSEPEILTPLELIDMISNQIEQMHLAHRTKDDEQFVKSHREAASAAFELTLALQEDDAD